MIWNIVMGIIVQCINIKPMSFHQGPTHQVYRRREGFTRAEANELKASPGVHQQFVSPMGLSMIYPKTWYLHEMFWFLRYRCSQKWTLWVVFTHVFIVFLFQSVGGLEKFEFWIPIWGASKQGPFTLFSCQGLFEKYAHESEHEKRISPAAKYSQVATRSIGNSFFVAVQKGFVQHLQAQLRCCESPKRLHRVNVSKQPI